MEVFLLRVELALFKLWKKLGQSTKASEKTATGCKSK
jgi:hypothetical protein